MSPATKKSDLRQYKTYGKNHRALRLEDWDYTTPCPYHIILTTYKRQQMFAPPEHAEIFIAALRQQIAHTGYHIFACCVMPDHVHILCQPFDPGSGGFNPPLRRPIDLSAFVQHLKIKSSHALSANGVQEPIWQRGFYDHILRREETIETIRYYILNNPVRTGLVADYEDYAFSFAEGIKSFGVAAD